MADEIEIPEGWTRHDGGECPVAYDVNVDVLFRDGLMVHGKAAWLWNPWQDRATDPDCDIIAYRMSEAK